MSCRNLAQLLENILYGTQSKLLKISTHYEVVTEDMKTVFQQPGANMSNLFRISVILVISTTAKYTNLKVYYLSKHKRDKDIYVQ